MQQLVKDVRDVCVCVCVRFVLIFFRDEPKRSDVLHILMVNNPGTILFIKNCAIGRNLFMMKNL